MSLSLKAGHDPRSGHGGSHDAVFKASSTLQLHRSNPPWGMACHPGTFIISSQTHEDGSA